MGRLRQRHARVARSYDLACDAKIRSLIWTEDAVRKEEAQEFDRHHLLETDRTDLTHDDSWRSNTTSTQVESAFRLTKSPLMERPICHHHEHCVQIHVLLCVRDHRLLIATEQMSLDRQVQALWASLRA